MAADTEGKPDESPVATASAPSAEGAADASPSSDALDRFGVDRARDILGELVDRARYGRERIVLTKGRYAKDAAALIGMEDLQRLLDLDRGAAA